MANSHTPEQRDYIVRRLAAFYTPQQIVAAFVLRFPDTRCDENDVLVNDPTQFVVPPELFDAFRKERERVLLDPSAAPFTDQMARLIVLSRQVERFERNNQPGEARSVMRQIAEELGVVGKTGSGKPAVEDKAPEVKAITVTRTVVHPPERTEE